MLSEEYSKYDRFTAQAEEYKARILEKTRSMEWETGTGTLPRDEMIRILRENNINITVDLATAYITCSLGSCNGLGKKLYSLLKDFLDHHVAYKEMYDEIQHKLNQKEDKTNEQT